MVGTLSECDDGSVVVWKILVAIVVYCVGVCVHFLFAVTQMNV